MSTIVWAAGTASAQSVTALSGSPEARRVPHLDATVEIDGRLDEEIWQHALVIELDIETTPRENEPAAVETFAYIIEDGTQLLVAFDARDPEPERIRAYLRDRDTAYDDDFVGIVLDTFNDERRGFEFFSNAVGVQMDLIVDDVNGGEDDSWNAIWRSAGIITDNGYTVEMAIPFSQLRFDETNTDQTWGVDVLRAHPRENRALLAATPRERGRNCYLCQLSKVNGFANIEPGRGLEIVPSLTASRTDTRDPSTGGLVNGDADSELGLNLRWSITSDLVANLALNPDFSQVEADVAQLDVNNRFALFYPETRPFFLEGANFFSTPIDAVFTRTVADPDVGVKLTGTSGANIFGVFAAEDAVTNLLFPGPFGSSSGRLDASSRSAVGRYRRDFGSSSTIGALVTSRSGDDYSNSVGGIDGRFRPNDRHSLGFQYLSSTTTYSDAIVNDYSQPAGTLEGDALRLNYEYGTRNWFAFANYRSFDPEFRADSGFVSQVDYENRSAGFGRIWHGDDDSWWNRLQTRVNAGSNHRQDGQLISRFSEINFSIQGPLQWFMQTGLGRTEEFFDGSLYDRDSIFMFSQLRPVSGLSIALFGWNGDQIDYVNSRLGRELRLEPSIDWNANRHMLVRLQQTIVDFDTQAGARIYDARLTDLRLTWQFSVRSFLRLTLQQQNVDRNPAEFTSISIDERSRNRGAELLYSYQLNPQTVIFAGYSDNHLANAELVDLTRTDRTLFLKLSYAWTP